MSAKYTPTDEQIQEAAAFMFTRGAAKRRNWTTGYDGPDPTQRLWIALARDFLQSPVFKRILEETGKAKSE